MKPSEISANIAKIIPTKRPVILHGAPGVGKSSLWQQAADTLRMDFRDVRGIYYDPTEISGVLYVTNGETFRSMPELLKSLNGNQTIICLDDFLQAPTLTLNAMSQMILDRRIGPHIVPDTVYFGAATNDQKHKAAVNRMPSQLVSRFIHLEQETDLDDWVRWALGNEILTQDIAFLRYRPELLHQFDPSVHSGPYPNPRSWHMNSDVFKAFAPDIPPFEVVSGTVGEGAAAERLGFERIFRKLPNPDKVLMDPDKAPVPDDPATLYALVGALARKASEQTMDRLVKYAGRLSPEFSVLLIKDCAAHDEEIVNTRAFIQWASDHQEVIF